MKLYPDKTTLIAVASAAMITLPVLNAFAADEKAPFDGAYIGGALTLGKFNNGASVTPNAASTSASTSESAKKFSGGIYGGFGKQIDQLYFGLEGGFYLNRNPQAKFSFGTTSTGLKAKNTFDLSGRIGFVADRALFYGLGGFTSTNFETFGLTSNESKRLSGFRYGGGIEFSLTPELSLRAEYTRANYKKWGVASGANMVNFDPRDNRFLIGASLRF